MVTLSAFSCAHVFACCCLPAHTLPTNNGHWASKLKTFQHIAASQAELTDRGAGGGGGGGGAQGAALLLAFRKSSTRIGASMVVVGKHFTCLIIVIW